MATRISKARFISLKHGAKRLGREFPELKHAQALDQIAVREGFNNWSQLARSVVEIGAVQSDTSAVQQEVAKPHSVTLYGSIWSLDPSIRRHWEETISTKYPAARYESFQWAANNFDFRGTERDRDLIVSKMATTKRAIAFMDATGLRTSRAFVRLLGRGAYPRGFDHTSIWRDEGDRYIVTTEPYIPALRDNTLQSWSSESGWYYAILEKGQGIWNPCKEGCRPDCTGHTQMVVLAPPKRGGDVAVFADALSNNRLKAA